MAATTSSVRLVFGRVRPAIGEGGDSRKESEERVGDSRCRPRAATRGVVCPSWWTTTAAAGSSSSRLWRGRMAMAERGGPSRSTTLGGERRQMRPKTKGGWGEEGSSMLSSSSGGGSVNCSSSREDLGGGRRRGLVLRCRNHCGLMRSRTRGWQHGEEGLRGNWEKGGGVAFLKTWTNGGKQKQEEEEEEREVVVRRGRGVGGTVRASSRRREEMITLAKKGAPTIAPLVASPAGIMDINSVLLQNRIVFIGSPIDARVAQRVISQLMALAAFDEEKDIKMYLNSPGGSIYSILAIYDCMSFIKPDVSTICLGLAASQSAILLAGGVKGKRFAMPNARIMIHQPQGGCGGTIADVRRQASEVMISRDKIDKMYEAFTGQPLEKIQMYTDRDRFFSAAEAMEFGLIDDILETEY